MTPAPNPVWTFKADSKLIAFYCWLYDSDASALTFCRLFWGVLASPLVLVVLGVVTPIVALSAKIHASAPLDSAVIGSFRAPRPNRASLFAAWVARVADAGVAWFQAHSRVRKTAKFTLKYVVPLVAIGAFIWVSIVYPHAAWIGVLWALYIVGCGLLGGVIGLFCGWLRWKRDEVAAGRSERGALTRYLSVVWRGAKRTFSFLVTGYHAVKNRTCPKIVVEDS